MLQISIKNGLRAFTTLIYPKLQMMLRFKSVDDDVEEFFLNLVKDTLEYREQNDVVRKDLFQLLIQLRNTGQVQQDGVWETKGSKNGSLLIKIIYQL